MANNYIQFSEMIDGITPEERTWIGSQLDPDLWGAHPPEWEAPVEDGCLGFEWSLDEVEGSLWFYAEETGSPEEAARFVRAFLARFRPEDSFGLTYADSCSKPRPGEFSGGAVFVTAGSIRHEDAYDWVRTRGKEHWFMQGISKPIPIPEAPNRVAAAACPDRVAEGAVTVPGPGLPQKIRRVAEECGWSDETVLDLVTCFLSDRERISPGVAQDLVSHLEEVQSQEWAFQDDDEEMSDEYEDDE